MIKRLMALVTILTLISFSTMGNESGKGLEELFQNYDLKMSVLWDQKDMKFAEKAKNDFTEEVKNYIKRNKVGKQELVTFAKKVVGDNGIEKSIESIVESVGAQQMSENEIVELMVKHSSNDQGASWTGAANAALKYGLYIVGTSLLVWAIVKSIDASKEHAKWSCNTLERHSKVDYSSLRCHNNTLTDIGCYKRVKKECVNDDTGEVEIRNPGFSFHGCVEFQSECY